MVQVGDITYTVAGGAKWESMVSDYEKLNRSVDLGPKCAERAVFGSGASEVQHALLCPRLSLSIVPVLLLDSSLEHPCSTGQSTTQLRHCKRSLTGMQAFKGPQT